MPLVSFVQMDMAQNLGRLVADSSESFSQFPSTVSRRPPFHMTHEGANRCEGRRSFTTTKPSGDLSGFHIRYNNNYPALTNAPPLPHGLDESSAVSKGSVWIPACRRNIMHARDANYSIVQHHKGRVDPTWFSDTCYVSWEMRMDTSMHQGNRIYLYSNGRITAAKNAILICGIHIITSWNGCLAAFSWPLEIVRPVLRYSTSGSAKAPGL